MIYLSLFSRAFLLVGLVSANTVQITRGDVLGAFVVGTAISYVWFTNARSAGRSEAPRAAWAYALGAGCGTAVGMSLSRLI